MNRFIITGIFLMGCLICQAQYAGYEQLKGTAAFKESFAKATAEISTITAGFIQEKSLSMLSEKINSSGLFWFEKKDRLRMEYKKPYAYLMILNGGKIYIKEGARENKISARSNKMFQQINNLLIDCVSGNILENKSFTSRLFEARESFLIELQPAVKNLRELYKTINIVLDKNSFAVKTLEMTEISGDQTTIRFQNKILNAKIPDSVFFIP